jgi:branched-chain amino acid aminotransferase
MEAVTNGYSEGLVLSTEGLLSEGSGQNVFLVRGGALVTPQLDGSLLRGITRDTVVKMATDLGIEVQERPVPREDLYTADEVFFTGTATEVTPIRSVDRITVGEGKPGPVTKAVQQRFLGVAKGTEEDLHGWLTPVCP